MLNQRAFFSIAFAVGTVLLAQPVASAGEGRGWRGGTNVPTPAPPPPPLSCRAGDFDVSVSSGPTFVPCDAPRGQCTEIEYVVATTGHDHKKKKPSHVFVLQGVGVWDVDPPGSQWYAPCEGIPGAREPGFGRDVCHEQAIKINTRQGVTRFKITLAGLRRPSPTSVAILTEADRHAWKRDDDDVEACTILGLGLEAGPNPDQTTLRKETINFKGCEVEFTRDAVNEEVVEARLLTEKSDSGEPCQSPTLDEKRIIKPLPVGEVEVSVGRFSLGSGKFGVGYVSTGDESCTTRVIGGRVYTWGSPCP